MISEVRINEDFVDFINTCFKDIKSLFARQHDQYNFGRYTLMNFLIAFKKFCSKNDKWEKQYRFDYNCSDCSFPKFKDLETGKTEACPECGD